MPTAIALALAALLSQSTDAGTAPERRPASAIGSLSGAGSPSDAGQAPVPAPVVTGPMTKEEIRAAIGKRTGAVRRCYELALTRDDPASAGTITVKFTIGADGAVKEASVAQASGSLTQQVQDCVVEAIRALKTSPPKGGGVVVITYPFTFKPR